MPHLNRPAKAPWVLAILLALSFAPSVFLAVRSLLAASRETWSDVFYMPFYWALGRTLKVLASVFVLSLVAGCPFGVAFGIWRFPGRQVGLALLSLPLLVPPFVWAIGLQGLKPFLPFDSQAWLDGYS